MNTCRICGQKAEMKKWTAKEKMYGTKEEFVYMLCPGCGCLQIENIPQNLGDYYSNQYYSFKERSGSLKGDNISGKKYLDVGCGSGAYLCKLAAAGAGELYGCDPFIEKDIFYENGVKIYKKTIHEMQGEFDYIFMMDSFEHMTDPHEVMDSLGRLLAPKGVVRIEIPVFPNIAFDMFGVNWYQLDAPRHIFLHGKKSMEYLAEKHNFVIVNSEWNSNNSQIVRSFLYSKDVCFNDQTQEALVKYFSQADLDSITKQCDMANQNEYGDHAVFYLMHKE